MKTISFKKIMCPTDFSAFSYYAIDYAIFMAKQFENTKLYLAHAIPYSTSSAIAGLSSESPSVNMEELVFKSAAEELEAFAKEKIPKGIEVQIDVLGGSRTYDCLNQHAVKNGIDLIVIATHGYGGLHHALFGSTTERLIRHASCPVLSINPLTKKE